MKICFLTHNLDIRNGGGRLVWELIHWLKKIEPRLEISVLTTVDSGSQPETPIIYSSRIKLFFCFGKIRAALRNCDVIHAIDGFPYGLIVALAGLGLKKKFIITLVGSGSLKPLYSWWGRLVLKWVYARADRLVAISFYTAREVQKKLPGLPIEVVPLGVDYDYFHEQAANVAEIEAEEPYILSVGRIKPRKGYHISLEVFSRVVAARPDLNLKYVIVGSGRGPYYEKLQRLVGDFNLTGKVFFKENISDRELAALYKKASLFLLLSQNDNYDIEGFGLVFLEAAAFGLPVIGAGDCGAEDAVRDGQNGFLVPPGDIAQAVEKTLALLSDKNLRKQFSINSINFAKKMSYRKVAEKYLSIYHCVLGR